MEKCQNDGHHDVRRISAHMVAWACNLSMQDAEARGFKVQGEPGLCSETMQEKKGRKEKYITSLINISFYLEWAYVYT